MPTVRFSTNKQYDLLNIDFEDLVKEKELSVDNCEQSQNQIATDLGRTLFFGSPDDCKHHFSQWESFKTATYCQGDMTGENITLLFNSNRNFNAPQCRQYSKQAFCYVTHKKRLAGMVFYYAKHDPAQWISVITPNVLLPAKERDVTIISSKKINLNQISSITQVKKIQLAKLYKKQGASLDLKINRHVLVNVFKELINSKGAIESNKLVVFSLLLNHPSKDKYPDNYELLEYCIAHLNEVLTNTLLLRLANFTFSTPLSPRQILQLIKKPQWFSEIRSSLRKSKSQLSLANQLEIYFFLEEAGFVQVEGANQLLNEILTNRNLSRIILSGLFKPNDLLIKTIFNDPMKWQRTKFIACLSGEVVRPMLQQISQAPLSESDVWQCLDKLMQPEKPNKQEYLSKLVSLLCFENNNNFKKRLEACFFARQDAYNNLVAFCQDNNPSEKQYNLLSLYYKNPLDKRCTSDKHSLLCHKINLINRFHTLLDTSLLSDISDNLALVKRLNQLLVDSDKQDAFTEAVNEVEAGCQALRQYLRKNNPEKYTEYLKSEVLYRRRVYRLIADYFNDENKNDCRRKLKNFKKELKTAESLTIGCLKIDNHKVFRLITAGIINAICIICFPLLGLNAHHKSKTGLFWFKSAPHSRELLKRSQNELAHLIKCIQPQSNS